MKPNRYFAIFAACSAVKAEPSTNYTRFQTFPPYGRYPVGGTIPMADKDAEYVFASFPNEMTLLSNARERYQSAYSLRSPTK